jgi:polyisoprenoid-binding protein YceI
MLRKLTALALGAGLLASSLPGIAADYTQTKGSSLTFSGRYQGDAFKGYFKRFTTSFSFDPANLKSSKLDVDIVLTGATAGNPDYDGELHGESFFNSGKFPRAHYSATTFRRLPTGEYAADGELTLRGVTRKVTLTFTWKPGANPVLDGSAVVKRLDFGVGGGDWADTKTIPNDIQVKTRVVFVPKK